ncbi:MAG: large conductance mechanosensitive channel protein MscL [Eubacterium sp.]|nr:large conductance mechanosensitive channel protein MscL [Eubacterium sp.]
MKGFINEFKEFISRGNVMDMAVGIIIGGAFTAIVTSLVEDIIMPIISLVSGGVAIEEWGIALAGGGIIGIGKFVQSIIMFILITLVIFCMVKIMNKARRKKEEEPEPEAPVKICPFCQSEIPEAATRCPHCTSELNAE